MVTQQYFVSGEQKELIVNTFMGMEYLSRYGLKES
jgi:hypothetical protein